VSRSLAALLDGLGHSIDALRTDAENISGLAVPSNYGMLTKAGGVPNTLAEVDARNIVADPSGLGHTWAGTNSALTPVAGPGAWPNAVRATSLTNAPMNVRAPFIPEQAGIHYWYAIARKNSATTMSVGVIPNIGPAINVVLMVNAPDGWTLYRGSATLTAGAPYWVSTIPPTAVAPGDTADLTGVTVVYGDDPGEPFSGDSRRSRRNAYSWEAGRNSSVSLRHGQTVDIIALRERLAGMDVQPVGLTPEQRVTVLLARRRARHHWSASAFIDMLVEIIQAEVPSFTADDIRLVQNFEAQSFKLLINYDPNGPLAKRIVRIVEATKPYPVRFENVWEQPDTATGFRADISRADIDAV
jgi:hypothetical protein